MESWVITFPSVFFALRAEKILTGKGIKVRLIPIPRELSSCCEGLAAELAGENVEQAVALLAGRGVEMVLRGVKITKK